MVKDGNKRVMVTLTPSTQEMLYEIGEKFGLNDSAVINMLIGLFHQERMNKH